METLSLLTDNVYYKGCLESNTVPAVCNAGGLNSCHSGSTNLSYLYAHCVQGVALLSAFIVSVSVQNIKKN